MKLILNAQAAETVNRITTAQGVLDAFNRIADFFTSVIVALAVVYMIYYGFSFLTAGGEEKKIGEAKKNILYGVIAILIIILASSAFRIVGGFIGGETDSNSSQNQEQDFNTAPK